METEWDSHKRNLATACGFGGYATGLKTTCAGQGHGGHVPHSRVCVSLQDSRALQKTHRRSSKTCRN